MEQLWDCIIVGGGPAGLSAAINLRQRGKEALVLSGGETLLAKAEKVDNYLGLPALSGAQMMERFQQHADALGVSTRAVRVGNVMPFDGQFMVNAGGDILSARAVVLACGVSKAAPVAGEAEFLGRGVSYCATCDGMLYRGRDVAVWGLGPEAPAEANFLQSIGCRVRYISARRPASLDAAIPHLPGRLEAVEGTAAAERVRVAGSEVPVSGVFILRAAVPADALVPGLALGDDGFVRVDACMETNFPGLFAAGDLTGKPLQVARAVGQGLVAGLAAAEYLDAPAASQK